MRIGCVQSCACVSYCYESAKQTLGTLVARCYKIRKDPEAFQKGCVLALSVIRMMNFYCHTCYLSHFITILDVSQSLDFYGICRFPRYLFHSYNWKQLDEDAILDQLETILCDNWILGIFDGNGKKRDVSVRQFAKQQLTAFLEEMVESDRSFHAEEEVKTVLYHWLVRALEVNPQRGFDPYSIDLRHLTIVLRPNTRMTNLINRVSILIDAACIPSFLRNWALLDLAFYANRLGRFPLFSWVPGQDLDDWIWVMMGTNQLLQFFQAASSLRQSDLLSPQETQEVRWKMAAALAEAAYSFAIVCKKDLRLITLLACVAKSLGLFHFLSASKPSFFKYELS